MWPRVVEIMLGVWLSLSPFIFGHDPTQTMRWVTDLGSGLVLVTLSLLSYWPPARYAHLGSIVVGLWLVTFGWYWEGYPTPAALQNDLTVGLLVLMFAILPSETNLPPRVWRESSELNT